MSVSLSQLVLSAKRYLNVHKIRKRQFYFNRLEENIFKMLKRTVQLHILKSLINRQICVRNYCAQRFVLPTTNKLKEIQINCEQNGLVLKSPYPSIAIPNLTVDQFVWKNLSKWQNHIAIECWETKKRFTYSQLRDHCAALAIRLRTQFHLNKDDIVGLCMPNHPEFVIAFLGSIEANLAVTTISPNFTAEEISRQLISSQPKVIFCTSQNADVLREACKLAQLNDVKLVAVKVSKDHSLPSDVINVSEIIKTDGLNLFESSKFNEESDPNGLCVLPYSSGTTGLPKGVMLSHNNITSNCEGMGTSLPNDTLIIPTTKNHQDVVPVVLPFYHCYALVVMLISKLALGCKIVSLPKYDPIAMLQIIHQSKATLLHVVPPIVIQLNSLESTKREHFDSVRHVLCAASSLAHADGERFREKAVNASFGQAYGLSETSPLATITPIGLNNYGTVGWPLSVTDVKIVSTENGDSRGLDVNQTGELWIKGPNIMLGYLGNDAATKETIVEGGWLRSGDIGHYDEQGLLYISDRCKELIKVNAYQVAPAELEALLRNHPAVAEAVVIGVPHPSCGEVPRAFVVLRKNSNVTAENLQEFVAGHVARYKLITGGIFFLDSIPKTATGKILRKDIRKMNAEKYQ